MSRAARWAALAIPATLAGVAAAIVLPDGGDGADGTQRASTARAARWTSLPPSPLVRTEVGAARVGRSIYVVGGFVQPNLVTTDQVTRYDISTGTWSSVAPLPVAVNHPAVAAGAGRCAGAVYVYGGYTGNGTLSAEVDALQRFDPRSGTWTVLPGSGVARAASTLAPVGCSLYAIGGASAGAPQRLVQIYDIRRGAWRTGPGMRVAREHLASATIGKHILVLGGRAGGENLDVVEDLDTRSRKWHRRPPIPTARSGFGAAVIGGWAVVVGGEELAPGGETIRPVQAFNPRSRRWRKLPGMLTPRHGLGVVAEGRRIFAVEGGPHPGASLSSVLEMLRVPAAVLPAASRFSRSRPGSR
jgi:N-acetylneuraminic acid mutarotase